MGKECNATTKHRAARTVKSHTAAAVVWWCGAASGAPPSCPEAAASSAPCCTLGRTGFSHTVYEDAQDDDSFSFFFLPCAAVSAKAYAPSALLSPAHFRLLVAHASRLAASLLPRTRRLAPTTPVAFADSQGGGPQGVRKSTASCAAASGPIHHGRQPALSPLHSLCRSGTTTVSPVLRERSLTLPRLWFSSTSSAPHRQSPPPTGPTTRTPLLPPSQMLSPSQAPMRSSQRRPPPPTTRSFPPRPPRVTA